MKSFYLLLCSIALTTLLLAPLVYILVILKQKYNNITILDSKPKLTQGYKTIHTFHVFLSEYSQILLTIIIFKRSKRYPVPNKLYI